MSIIFQSMKQWPGKLRTNRGKAGFKSSHVDTLNYLARELRLNKARDPRVELAMSAFDFTNSGLPRAQAKPEHPGVIVTFGKLVKDRDGKDAVIPIVLKCDMFQTWESNLRAIAIGMEDLRRVERYGVVSERGEHWLGFKALPAPGPEHRLIATVEDAGRFISAFVNACCGKALTAEVLMSDVHSYRANYRLAAANLHEDAGRDGPERGEKWERLQAAKALLDRHHGL